MPAPLRSVALTVLLVIGCSDGSSSSGPPVEAAQLSREVAQVFCGQMKRCCSAADLAGAGPAFAAVLAMPSCGDDARLQAFVDDEFNIGRFKESIAAGRATLDGALARACVTALAALPCPDWASVLAGQQARIPPVCRDMIRGATPDGQPCSGVNRTHECAGATCMSGGPTGICRAPLEEGARCDPRCEDVFDCAYRCAGDLRCGAEGVCARNATPEPSPSCDGI